MLNGVSADVVQQGDDDRLRVLSRRGLDVGPSELEHEQHLNLFVLGYSSGSGWRHKGGVRWDSQAPLHGPLHVTGLVRTHQLQPHHLYTVFEDPDRGI